MIKLTITYIQNIGGVTLKDSYARYYPDGVNIELEKHRIRQDLISDSHVHYVYIKEEKIIREKNK